MWHSTIDALNRMFHKLTCLRTNPLCIVETNPYLSIYNENRVNLWDISPNIIPNWRKPKRKKHKCMSIISLDPCQTWMKICFQHVGVLVHDFMNERRKKKQKKTEPAKQTSSRPVKTRDQLCTVLNLATAWSMTVIIALHRQFSWSRRHLIHSHSPVELANDRAEQFAKNTLLSVGVNSHAIRFQRLYYRFEWCAHW